MLSWQQCNHLSMQLNHHGIEFVRYVLHKHDGNQTGKLGGSWSLHAHTMTVGTSCTATCCAVVACMHYAMHL